MYYGTKNPSYIPYNEELEKWHDDYGIKIIHVHSDDNMGYIQDVFEKENLLNPELASKTGIILCGQKEMCISITEIAKASGVDPDKILLNF